MYHTVYTSHRLSQPAEQRCGHEKSDPTCAARRPELPALTSDQGHEAEMQSVQGRRANPCVPDSQAQSVLDKDLRCYPPPVAVSLTSGQPRFSKT